MCKAKHQCLFIAILRRYCLFANALFAAISIGLHACTNDHFIPVNTPTTTGITAIDTSKLCFSADVFPIIQNNCAINGCHDFTYRSSGVWLTQYSEIVKNTFPGDGSNSVLYIVTSPDANPVMPPYPYDPLTSVQREIIKDWINQGATERDNCK